MNLRQPQTVDSPVTVSAGTYRPRQAVIRPQANRVYLSTVTMVRRSRLILSLHMNPSTNNNHHEQRCEQEAGNRPLHGDRREYPREQGEDGGDQHEVADLCTGHRPDRRPVPLQLRLQTGTWSVPAVGWAGFIHQYRPPNVRNRRLPSTYCIGVEDQKIFSMAGIWETWSSNGDEFSSVAIITTDSNDVVAKLHDRMPVILDGDEEAQWLGSEGKAELTGLLDPFPDERTGTYGVSAAVNSPANDEPDLVQPVGSDQSGLEEFGSRFRSHRSARGFGPTSSIPCGECSEQHQGKRQNCITWNSTSTSY